MKKILFEKNEAEDIREELESSLDSTEQELRREIFQELVDSPGWREVERWIGREKQTALVFLEGFGSSLDSIRFYQGYLKALKDLEGFVRENVGD